MLTLTNNLLWGDLSYLDFLKTSKKSSFRNKKIRSIKRSIIIRISFLTIDRYLPYGKYYLKKEILFNQYSSNYPRFNQAGKRYTFATKWNTITRKVTPKSNNISNDDSKLQTAPSVAHLFFAKFKRDLSSVDGISSLPIGG